MKASDTNIKAPNKRTNDISPKGILESLSALNIQPNSGLLVYTGDGEIVSANDLFWKMLRCDEKACATTDDIWKYSLLDQKFIGSLEEKWKSLNKTAGKKKNFNFSAIPPNTAKKKKFNGFDINIIYSDKYRAAGFTEIHTADSDDNTNGRLANLIESLHGAIPTGVMAFDDFGRLIYVNPAFCTMVGYSQKELLGKKPPYIFWSPEAMHEIISAHQNIAAGKSDTNVFELIFSKKSGERMNVQVFVSTLDSDEDTRISVCSIIDITERKILTRKLRESEYLYRSIAENMNDVVWLYDLKKDNYTYISPSIKNLLGYEASELLDKNITYTLPQSNHREIRELLAGDFNAIKQNPGYQKTRYYTAEQILRNGNRIFTEIKLQYIVDKSGNALQILGVSRDITEKIKLENKLSVSERISKEAQRITEIGFWEYDIARDSLHWSDEVFRIYDVDPRQFPGSYNSFLNFVHPDDRDTVNAAYVNSLKEQKPYSIDHRLLMPDGKIKWVREAGENIFDEEGKPVRTIGSVQNITEKKLTENQLLFTQHVVEHSSEATFWIKSDSSFFYVNNSACNELRYSFSELCSLSVLDIDPTFTEDQWDLLWEKARISRVYTLETLYRRKDGTVYPVEVRANFVDYAGESFICAYVSNITKRKEYEKKLQDNESKFRGLFQSSVDGIAIANEHGNFIDANSAFLRLAGYNREELLAMNFAAIHPDESLNFVSSEFRKLFDGVKQYSSEIPVKKKNGEVVFVSVTTFSILWDEERCVVGIFTDVSELKRLNESLEKSVLRYKRAMEADQAGIFELNLYTGKLTASQSFYTVFDVNATDGEIDSSEINRLIVEEDAVLFEKTISECRNGNRDSYSIEYRIRKNDGVSWISGRGKVFEKDEEGKGTYLIGTVEDITALKVAREKLVEEKERLERISDALPGAIMKFKLKPDGALSIPYTSARVEDVYGLPAEEIMSDFNNFSKRINDADLFNLFEKVILSAQTLQPWVAVYRYNNPKKGLVWIEAKSIPFRDEANNVVWYGYADDVNDRKKSDFQIQQLQERFSIAFHSSPAALVITRKEDGKIIDVNDAFCVVTEYSRDEVLGLTSMELNLFQSPEDWENMLSGLSENASLKNLEQTILTRSRKTRHILISAESIELDNTRCLLSFFFDITDRKEMDDALRESESRYRLISENVSDVIWTMKSGANRFNYISPSVKKLLGYSPEEVMSKPLSQIMTPESLKQFNEYLSIRFKNFLASPQTGKYFVDQLDQPTKWGDIVHTEVSSTFTMNKEGEVEIIGVTRDITERKLAEEKIRQLNSELEQKVRERTSELQRSNQELESFAYSVSHDLRAPLRAIDGFSVILQEEYINKLDPDAQAYFGRIRSNIGRMGQMIEDLLRLSRIMRSEISYTSFDIAAIAGGILHRFAEAEPERKVEILLPPTTVIKADKNLIGHLLENLLSNAWKFTSKCTDAKIEFGMEGIGPETVFFVKDNGAGFDMNYANKLFGVFQRLHSPNEFPGIGIGLALVQRIVNRHGGKIWAEGEVNKGAVFNFTLPLSNV